MTPIRAATRFALVMSVALATAGHAGDWSVGPTGPVFVPPLFNLPGSGQSPVGSTQVSGTEEEIIERALRGFADAQSFCARLPAAEYQVDCLANQLEQLVAALPSTPEFDEARLIVQDTARQLNSVARSKASTTKRPATLREDRPVAPRRSTRPIIPVATTALTEAATEATAILQEAETLLLRAAERSERRKVPYTQIAQAVGSSSTILLRAR